jgi:small GTP-binding protein
MELVLWDIYGEDDFQKMRTSYLRGASGYLLVIDGTRASTLETAEGIRDLALGTLGAVPFVLVANKADLADSWEVSELRLQALAAQGWPVVRTSAKTGEGVHEAFTRLARAMVAR